jgi:hypothetical protein
LFRGTWFADIEADDRPPPWSQRFPAAHEQDALHVLEKREQRPRVISRVDFVGLD